MGTCADHERMIQVSSVSIYGACCKADRGTWERRVVLQVRGRRVSNLLSEGVPDTELNYACGNIDDPSKIWPRCCRSTERRGRGRRVGPLAPDGVVIREVRCVKNVEAFR